MLKGRPQRLDKKVAWDKSDAAHSWHPFTQMQEYLSTPIVHIARGEGCWLYDTEGNRYLDGNASMWCNVHGHSNPELNAVLIEQIQRCSHSTYLGLSHPKAAELCQKLASITPEGLTRTFFTDNGACAIETAIKLSFRYWALKSKPEKTQMIGINGGYHGDTFGCMAVSDAGYFHDKYKHWCFDCQYIPAPTIQDSETSLAKLKAILKHDAHKIAAIVMEPSIQGPAGMRLQPKNFLKSAEQLCHRYNIHLILDEIFVGFCRAGDSLFVCSQEDVKPDFLCLSKGFSGGYLPLAATVTTEAIYKAFCGPVVESNAFFHGHTFAANPVAAAVALKSIEMLEEKIASGAIAKMQKTFAKITTRTFANHPFVSQIRQRGFVCAIDLYPGEEGKFFPVEDRVGHRVCLKARDKGLSIRPLLDSILIIPPIAINEEEIEFLSTTLSQSITEVINQYLG